MFLKGIAKLKKNLKHDINIVCRIGTHIHWPFGHLFTPQKNCLLTFGGSHLLDNFSTQIIPNQVCMI